MTETKGGLGNKFGQDGKLTEIRLGEWGDEEVAEANEGLLYIRY